VHPLRAAVVAVVILGSDAHADSWSPTLDEAIARAEERSPAIRKARAELAQAAGRRTTAGYLVPSNPQLELGLETDAPFEAQGDRSIDVGIEQELEIFGQRGLRIEVADSELAELTLRIAAARRHAGAEVATAYVDLMFEERRAVALGSIVDQAARLEEAARRRAAAGDLSAAEHTLIRADLIMAQANARTADADRVAALARLGVLVGSPPGQSVATSGDLPAGAPAGPVDHWLTLALDGRADLRAAAQAITTGSTEIALRQRERWPNLTIALGYTRDRARFASDDFEPPGVVTSLSDRGSFLGVSLAVPLPLFRTGRGEIAEARGRRAQAEAERDALRAEVEADLTAAHARYEDARLRALDLGGVEAELAVTLGRYEAAFTSGQIDLPAFLAIRDRVLEVQLAALAARHDAAVARIALELAAGGAPERRR
jgi:cobalt-zinc-cadmium efflux system outer membrane protein